MIRVRLPSIVGAWLILSTNGTIAINRVIRENKNLPDWLVRLERCGLSGIR